MAGTLSDAMLHALRKASPAACATSEPPITIERPAVLCGDMGGRPGAGLVDLTKVKLPRQQNPGNNRISELRSAKLHMPR